MTGTLRWTVPVLLLLLAGEEVSAAWHDGNRGSVRTGSRIEDRTGLAELAKTARACFSACQAAAECEAWNFASHGCAGSAGCQLLAENTLPLYTTPKVDGVMCNSTSGSKSAAEGLLPLKYKSLSLGSVAPTGWLRRQLIIMANGLPGHLDLFWNDVNESVWIGGAFDHSGAGHERGPYWLNGMVPLLALLNASGDVGTDALDIDLNKQVNSWVSYILEHQLPSGWLGPDDGFGGKGNTYWTGWNIAASLLQYADAVGISTPMGKRCGAAVIAYIKEVTRRMSTAPTTSWTQNRWQDWVYIVHWALDQDPQGQEQLLWDAGALAQAQSWDWDAFYDRSGVGSTGAYAGKPMPKYPLENVAHWDMYDHGVNNAMGTKSCSTWYRQSRNKSAVDKAYHKLYMQDTYHGQPHGMFSADECYGGRALNRGIELCAVVEQMYSLQHMFRVHGDPYFLDRCERISYNSLPGTITADMWQHQYLQQANEITALYGQTQHPWQTDGPDSTGFGVAPNFGCCTANMQQGWPKMAMNVLLADPEGGYLLGMIAPVKLQSSEGVVVEVITDYPFGDAKSDVTILVTAPKSMAVPMSVRIPSWADKATLKVDNKDVRPAPNGTIVKSICKGSCTIVLSLNPEVRLEYGWGLAAKPVPPVISYKAGGASIPSNISNWAVSGLASIVPSMKPGFEDLRSGDPGENNTVYLTPWIFSAGHSIQSVSFTYSYVAGYGPVGNPKGPIIQLSIVGPAPSTEVIAVVYTSPVLNKYSFDHFTGYSPAITATADNLNIITNSSVRLALTFINNEQNIQIPVDASVGLNVKVSWGPSNGRPAGNPGIPSSDATNAVSVLRGPLLYSLPLEEHATVVKTWAPFNNTDVDLTTSSMWNFALDITKPITFKHISNVSSMPFGTKYPTVLQASARRLLTWKEVISSADEPQPSPLTCGSDNCGPTTMITLVPYGATNLRISALPWFSP